VAAVALGGGCEDGEAGVGVEDFSGPLLMPLLKTRRRRWKRFEGFEE